MVMPEVHTRRNDAEGPPTYRNPSQVDEIAYAAGLIQATQSLTVLDVMSRHGRLAEDLRHKAPQHSYFALAVSKEQLANTPDGIQRIITDARTMEGVPVGSDVVVVRYGIKDFPQDQQLGVLKSIGSVLKPSGALVVTDMISPPNQVDNGWLNEQHRLKQRLEGRNIERDGECYIPTEEEWLAMLSEAGFSAEVYGGPTSYVATTDWVKGGQITDEQREEMDRFLLHAPEVARDIFAIHIENGVVNLRFPVRIFRAHYNWGPRRDSTDVVRQGEV